MPTLRWILRYSGVLLLCCAAGILAASAAGERVCCRVVAFTALNGYVYQVYTLDVNLGIAYHPLPVGNDVRSRAGDYLAGWLPGGSGMIFTSERGRTTGLYVMESSGRNVRRLPDDCLAQVTPSPDGTYLLCLPPTVGERDFRDAYVIPVDDRPVRRLNQLAGRGTRFAVASPDGRRILYDESNADGALVMVVNATGTESTRVTEITGLSGLAWLPDNRISLIGLCDNRMSVVVQSLENGPRTCVTIFPTPRPRYTWSPDGKFLAYTALCDTRDRLAVVTLETGEATCLPESGGILMALAWSPDGQTLAWGAQIQPEGWTRLWLYDTHTGERTLLFTDVYHEGLVGLRWSPDGRALSFALVKWNGGTDGSYLLDRDSGVMRKMLPGTYLETGPFVWQPG